MTDKHAQPTHALLDAWETLKRYRWRFVLPAFVLSAVALAVSLFIPRVYKSDATFERRHEVVTTDSVGFGQRGRHVKDTRAAVLNEIKNPAAVERVVQAIAPTLRDEGLGASSGELSQLKFEIARHSAVSFELSDPERDLVRVSFKTDNPRVAQLVVDGLVAEYIDAERREVEQKIDESADFFRGEVARHREIIRGIENKLLDFEMRHARLLPDSPSSITDSLYEERQSLDNAITERNVAVGRTESLEEALAAEPTHVETLVNAKNPELSRLEGERRDAIERIGEYTDVLKMKERHPDLVAARAQLAKIDEAIAAAPAEVLAERQRIANP
ncbi:MAG: hypothetical protein AAGB29_14090, partial [Planctomycetota bacterium]